MFCKYCGKEIQEGRELCDECLATQMSNNVTEVKSTTQNVESQESSAAFVSNNNVNPVMTNSINNTNPISQGSGNNTNPINMNVNNNNANFNATNKSQNNRNEAKSKMAAGLFGIFLGVFGVHNFYLGYTGKAVAQLLITLLSCGLLSPVSGIWGLIEGILILAGETKTDAYGNELKE